MACPFFTNEDKWPEPRQVCLIYRWFRHGSQTDRSCSYFLATMSNSRRQLLPLQRLAALHHPPQRRYGRWATTKCALTTTRALLLSTNRSIPSPCRINRSISRSLRGMTMACRREKRRKKDPCGGRGNGEADRPVEYILWHSFVCWHDNAWRVAKTVNKKLGLCLIVVYIV